MNGKVRWKNKALVAKGASGWKYARTLKDMPRQTGRYLFVNELGTFFFGHWDANERKLYTQCIGYSEDAGVRRTNGQVHLASWDWKSNGHVFWKDVGEISFYEVFRRAGGDRRGLDWPVSKTK